MIKNILNLLNNSINTLEIKGKIVLIGTTAKSIKDVYEIPQSRHHVGESFLQIPGVEIHALRVLNLITLLQDENPSIYAFRS